MNREFWKNISFTNENPQHFPCPKCSSGILIPKEKMTVFITEGGREMEKFGYPYGIEHIFSGILTCKNNNCKELISIGGICLKDIAYAEELPDGQMVEKRCSQYEPKYFYPNLKIFNLKNEIPDNVRTQINLSFSHFYNDLSSCANKIRIAIELILNDLKASKWRRTNKNKIHYFTDLHSRIEHFATKNKEVSNQLLALKIIGNEGSHIGDLTINDILDAYEILEQLIEFAYIKNRKRISALVDEIVSRKKPRSKK